MQVVQRKHELGAGTYDAECARGELAKAIIMHEYPLSIMDHLGFRRYSAALQPVFQLLDSLDGRVVITSDMWTSTNQKRGFIYVLAPHTSDRLCNVLIDCLMDWNIDTKVSTITLDNCTTNDAMIDKIKDKLHLGSMLRDGSLLHMHCCAHILNLIVKDGLEVVKEGVEKIWDSVAYWTTTPKRKEKFEEMAK
ncbi:putative AC transposase [Glycine soja]